MEFWHARAEKDDGREIYGHQAKMNFIPHNEVRGVTTLL